MLGWWYRKNSEDNRPVFVVDRQERLSSSLCSLSYLTLFECLRKWDGASELRVAVVTDVGVISPPASLSFGSYWLNRVCILPGYAAITPWQFQVSCIWLLTGVHQVLSCDGGGYGCVLLSFPCYELVMSDPEHLETESASAARDHSPCDSKSKLLVDLSHCFVMNWIENL